MNELTNFLSGAGSAGNQAADTTGGYYNSALQREINSTGSPAAQKFAAEENASLQPQFKTQDQNLAAQEAAMGIGQSGAGKNDFSNLQAQQSATLAGNEAPLYSQALAQYGNINAAEAPAQSNSYSSAFNQAEQQFMQAAAAAAGAPSIGGTPTGSGTATVGADGNVTSMVNADGSPASGYNQDANGNFTPTSDYSAFDVPQNVAVQAPNYNPYSNVGPQQ